MKVIKFRSYKKYTDEELICKAHNVFKKMRREGNGSEIIHICNEMIAEAKKRKLKCSKEALYNNILDFY
ncbi:hypothetical protein IZY60_13010 [Lutibacter sp. B2]|nr:hypothetical protein [Lutibacter sp. B2]